MNNLDLGYKVNTRYSGSFRRRFKGIGLQRHRQVKNAATKTNNDEMTSF